MTKSGIGDSVTYLGGRLGISRLKPGVKGVVKAFHIEDEHVLVKWNGKSGLVSHSQEQIELTK